MVKWCKAGFGLCPSYMAKDIANINGNFVASKTIDSLEEKMTNLHKSQKHRTLPVNVSVRNTMEGVELGTL